MTQTQQPSRIMPRLWCVPCAGVWIALMSWIVPLALQKELASPEPPGMVVLVAGIGMLSSGAVAFTAWFIAMPMLLLYNAAARSRRERFGSRLRVLGFAYVFITVVDIAMLLLIVENYPPA